MNASLNPAAPSLPCASIVIPTFNGAARLPRVLASLAAQTAPDGSFEVIVVDNASTDQTSTAAREAVAVKNLRERDVEVRVIGESRQGTTHARIRGVIESRSDLVCFLDDDNIPEPEYIANGLAVFGDPSVALAVSRIFPNWEFAPPPSIMRRQHLYAVNDYLGDSWKDWGAEGTIVPTTTAGMWVRREAFIKAIPCDRVDLLLAGRVGRQLFCGEDIEIGLLIGRAGYRRVYAPALKIAHDIPQRRLETAYVTKLIEGIVRSELTLREKYEGAKFGLRDRITACMRLAAALCAIPALALMRRDARREITFVIAARRAHLRGPIRSDA
jgi:glycosyltransferase involved in cell wall biosynthesis